MIRAPRLLRLPSALYLTGVVLLGTGAWTVCAAQQRDEVAHTVRPGDTLEGIAQSYFGAPQLWQQLQARNKVKDPRHLQPGSTVWVPVHLQPQETARVEFAQGCVEATAPAQRAGQPIAERVTAGTTLNEGTRLEVGPDSFVTVRLADGSVVRVNAQSEVQLRQLRRRGRNGPSQSVLEVNRGRVESSVTPTPDGTRRFEVRTPRAVTSVRGTRYDVALQEGGQTVASVLEGSVAVQGRESAALAPAAHAAMLEPGQGIAVQADGTVGAVRPLLPPPDLRTVPKTLHEPGLLALDLPEQPQASAYQALIARDAGLTQVLRTGTFATGRIRWPGLEDGQYFVSVRAVDSAGIAGLPATQPIAVKTQPVPPLYQTPAANGVVPHTGAHLICTEVPGMRWYHVQVSTQADFSQLLKDESRLSTCKLPVEGLPLGHYFWRAASVQELADGAVDPGPFAAPLPFTVVALPPTLSAQALQTSDGEATVSLRWPAQPGQRFRLQLARDLAFASPVRDTELSEPHWTASDLDAGTYYVRIQVLDASGLQGDFSPARTLRVGTGFSTSFGLPVSDSSGEAVRRP